MRGNPVPEKSVLRPPAGAVIELRWQKHIPWRIFLLQTPDRGDGDNPADVERTKGVDVGAVIQLVRQNAMAASMSGQEENASSAEFAADDRIRRLPERRVDLMFLSIADPFDLVKSTPADDADGWLFVIHLFVVTQVSRVRCMLCKPEPCATLGHEFASLFPLAPGRRPSRFL